MAKKTGLQKTLGRLDYIVKEYKQFKNKETQTLTYLDFTDGGRYNSKQLK